MYSTVHPFLCTYTVHRTYVRTIRTPYIRSYDPYLTYVSFLFDFNNMSSRKSFSFPKDNIEPYSMLSTVTSNDENHQLHRMT